MRTIPDPSPSSAPALHKAELSVTDGIEAAVARAQQVAGEKNVGVAAGTIARHALKRACSTRSPSTWCRS
jgi:hypothetical protein